MCRGVSRRSEGQTDDYFSSLPEQHLAKHSLGTSVLWLPMCLL